MANKKFLVIVEITVICFILFNCTRNIVVNDNYDYQSFGAKYNADGTVEIYHSGKEKVVLLKNERTFVCYDGKELELPEPEYIDVGVIKNILEKEKIAKYKLKKTEYNKRFKKYDSYNDPKDFEYSKTMFYVSPDDGFEKEEKYFKVKSVVGEIFYENKVKYEDRNLCYELYIDEKHEMINLWTRKNKYLYKNILKFLEVLITEIKCYHPNGSISEDYTIIDESYHMNCKYFNYVYRYKNKKLVLIEGGETDYFRGVYTPVDVNRLYDGKEPIGNYWWHNEMKRRGIKRKCR